MKVKMLKLLSPLLVLALALSLMAVVLPQTASASPAEWHVSTTGSDTEGDGSSGNPWRTIQHAVYDAGVGNGDTIIVHAGTYTENVNVDKELTIRAATGDNVTVQALDPDDHVLEVTADSVTISGFTVTNATGEGMAGIYLGNGVDHCTITNNTASGNDLGIFLDHSSDNTISSNSASDNRMGICLVASSDNTIEGNAASNNDHGIYLYASSDNTLGGNTASDNNIYGIWLSHSNDNTLSGNNTASGSSSGIHLAISSENTIEDNTASGNYNGIYLGESSGNTISDNTASDNSYGIYLSSSSNNTVSGNIANGNHSTGIYLDVSSDNNIISGNAASDNWWGIYLYSSSNNTVSGNTANENNYEGICLDESSNNTVSGNIASGNTRGIEAIYSSDNNTFLNNTVHDNGHGIYVVDSSGNWFVGNDISGNTAEDSGVHLSGDVAGNQFLFNNIVNNTAAGSYGVYNEAADIVNATLNWWGDASGPSGVGPGTGDAVSDNVTFEPWLGASVVGVTAEAITGAQTDVEISGPAGSDTWLTVDTAGDVTVIVALYSGNPHPEEQFPDIALGKYIDIYASDPDAIGWPVYVEMSYTEDEVAAAGIDESTLGLYYWDASANEFHRCSDTGVDTDSNIIWANVDEDEASGLAGTPFAPGGAAPGGLSSGAIAGIVVGACAAAGLIAYFLIRRRRAAGKRA